MDLIRRLQEIGVLSRGEFTIYSEIKDGNVLQRLNILGSKLDSFNDSCDMVLDFRKAFDGVNHPIFWDPGHVSNTGNQIIAKKMFLKFRPQPQSHTQTHTTINIKINFKI